MEIKIKKYTLALNNWFYTKLADGTRMWAFNTSGFGFVKAENYFLFYIDFLFWDIAIEKGKYETEKT